MARTINIKFHWAEYDGEYRVSLYGQTVGGKTVRIKLNLNNPAMVKSIARALWSVVGYYRRCADFAANGMKEEGR